MALTDKNIIITPNIGQTEDPKIVFSGANASIGAQNITLNVSPTDTGTLSFEGSSGKLLSMSNDMSGYVFSVNDISGIPLIDAHADGSVRLTPFGGTVYAGNLTSGLGIVPPVWTYRRTADGTAIGPAVTNVFPTPSILQLEGASVYKITGSVYFLKTTAGTVTWNNLFSSSPSIFEGVLRQSPLTGFSSTAATYTPLSYNYYIRAATGSALSFGSASTLTTGVNHFITFENTVITNAATYWRLRITQSAGTITPLAGSYYTITKIGNTTGNFI